MSIIKPFRALRPVPEKAQLTACVPYDVVYDEEAREYIEKNPLNFLRVTRPEADFPVDANPNVEEIFAKAKENLQKFIDDEIFAYEAEPCLYVYRLAADEHSQTGIVGCCSLDEYELGLIKKHEKTRPDKVEDRTAHIIAVRAQTGLIFLAFRNTDKIRTLISEITQTTPIYDFYCPQNVRQIVWRITQTENWTEAFAEVPALYVADGHHRIESANLAGKKLAAQNPEHSGAEDYNFVVAGVFPAEDLQILAYNRVVKDLNNLTEQDFLQRIGENFIVSETDEKKPKSRGEFCMYLSGKWYELVFNEQFIRGLNPIEKLDVSILQNYLLAPVLGIDDPRTNTRIAFVGGGRGTDELEKMVDEGAARVAFSLFPTTMDDLFAVADMNEIMPPKSTWFEPKLKDGLLVHLI
ncbi:MAG: DUF1015 domain-containing protein [Pyrinomonadaceae bacterium]|nr:DUF1015 domain-containing protein [Pyrinomonadaceae bacterium]